LMLFGSERRGQQQEVISDAKSQVEPPELTWKPDVVYCSVAKRQVTINGSGLFLHSCPILLHGWEARRNCGAAPWAAPRTRPSSANSPLSTPGKPTEASAADLRTRGERPDPINSPILEDGHSDKRGRARS
jgi:hypothetical protein